MATIQSSTNTAISLEFNADWRSKGAKTYRCHVCLIREEDDTFSAVVLNLPGAGSCGDTEEDAMNNVREAILGVIESHTEAGEEIPWKDSIPCDIPENATQKWILVDA